MLILSRRPEGTRRKGLPFTTQSKSDAIDVFDTVLNTQPRKILDFAGLSATIWNYAEQFRGRVLRPASRDLSGDARSGNINPAEPSDEGRTFEQRSASGQADPVDQHPDISSLHNVSRTGISLSRDDANLFFPQGYPQASTPIEWWS